MKEENKYKFISFLDKKSLDKFNEIAKKFGIKYSLAKKRKPIEEKIDFNKLMRQKPGFGDK